MDRNTYRRFPERDLIGLRVRSTRSLGNKLGRMPEGAIFTIKKKWGGLTLESDPCHHCGIKLRIANVDPRDVEFE